ncbi:LysR family transcriptional regulator [Ramlibacter sp. AN1015]|uniref:LysR family transcriptional regulator n=1 Tax=Ramlibacter sp. AN1015 TaxID=3133428 RepID=UPI0030C54A02
MNLRQLRYFCEVVEAGNARAAAQRLFVAPTAISMQLSQLEERLGGPLFDRASRPMALTPLGRFVYPKARQLLFEANDLESQAQGMAAGNLGWLSIGFTRSTLFSILPEAVRVMQASYPRVRIELAEVLSAHQPASLRSGAIHVGLARVLGPTSREPDLQYDELFDDPLVAAVPLQHPLAARKSLRAADLDALPYISFPKDANSHFSRQIMALLQAAGASPHMAHEAKEIHTALALVAAGLGATVVGRSVAANNRADVRFLPIRNLQAHSTVLAVHKRGDTNLLVGSFLEVLRAQAPPRAPGKTALAPSSNAPGRRQKTGARGRPAAPVSA